MLARLGFACWKGMTTRYGNRRKCVVAAPEHGPGTIPKAGLEAAMGGCHRLA